MYDDEAREYLIKAFGTYKIGECKKCNKKEANKQRAIYVGNLPCGYNSCIMQVKLDLFQDQQNSKLQKSLGIQPSPMQSKIAKLNFLGFDEHIVPPWMLMKSPTGGVYWFNPKLHIYGDKIYEDVYAFPDIIICANQIKQLTNCTKQTAEMYSVDCGNMNILYDFPEAVYTSGTKFGGYSRNENLGYATFNVKDTSNGIKMTLIASKYGTRLVVPYTAGIALEQYDNGLLITLNKVGETKRIVKTDIELKIQRKSKDLIAFNI